MQKLYIYCDCIVIAEREFKKFSNEMAFFSSSKNLMMYLEIRMDMKTSFLVHKRSCDGASIHIAVISIYIRIDIELTFRFLWFWALKRDAAATRVTVILVLLSAHTYHISLTQGGKIKDVPIFYLFFYLNKLVCCAQVFLNLNYYIRITRIRMTSKWWQ